MLKLVQSVYKAIAGAVASGLATYIAVAPDGVTAEEWGKVAGAVVAAALVVFFARNKVPAV